MSLPQTVLVSLTNAAYGDVIPPDRFGPLNLPVGMTIIAGLALTAAAVSLVFVIRKRSNQKNN